MKLPIATLVFGFAFFSVSIFAANTFGHKGIVTIPQNVHKNWADDLLKKDYPDLIHEEINKQLIEQGYGVILRSRRAILENGCQSGNVLEVRCVGGGISPRKESLNFTFDYFRLINKKPKMLQEEYSDYEVDLKGIKSLWETENFWHFDLKISGKNEQEIRKKISKSVEKILSKNKF